MNAYKDQSFYKLGLFFLMEVAEYVLGAQNRKLIVFLQYIHIYIKKECHSYFCVLYNAKDKSICAIFQKKGKKGQIFENLGKNVQNLKIF